MKKKPAPKHRPGSDDGATGRAIPSTSRTRRARLARALVKGGSNGIWAVATRFTIETLWSWLSS